ncbi:Uncharacterized protein TPAR_02452, partial [Tolypocladium paradoxum]
MKLTRQQYEKQALNADIRAAWLQKRNEQAVDCVPLCTNICTAKGTGEQRCPKSLCTARLDALASTTSIVMSYNTKLRPPRSVSYYTAVPNVISIQPILRQSVSHVPAENLPLKCKLKTAALCTEPTKSSRPPSPTRSSASLRSYEVLVSIAVGCRLALSLRLRALLLSSLLGLLFGLLLLSLAHLRDPCARRVDGLLG